jgi:excisionase family DNA binding protein
MSKEYGNIRSLEVVGSSALASATVPSLSPKPAFGEKTTELLTVQELAERLRLPESWVRARTRSRTLDPLPCVRLGRYTRFRWSAVEAWLREHEERSCG